MTSIFFIDSRQGARIVLDRGVVPCAHVLQIKYDANASAALLLLQERIPSLQLLSPDHYVEGYERRHADLVGALNLANSGEPSWWAFDLTNKNPITTRLFYAIYHVLVINRIIDRDTPESLFVVADDIEAFEQLRRHYRASSTVQLFYLSTPYPWGKVLQHFLPVAPIYQCLRALAGKVIAHASLSKLPAGQRSSVVVMSLLYDPVFKGDKYEDVYFGGFIDFLRKRNIAFISLMEVCAPYQRMMAKARRFGREAHVYPKEYFISVGQVMTCLGQGLKEFFGPRELTGSTILDDLDVRYLVERFLQYERSSTRYVSNLLMREAVKGFVRRQGAPDIFFYPFENRSFEKMMILALRTGAPATRITGYQHASFSARHVNFLLAEGEADITPLPDKIMALGEATRDILARIGKFPPAILEVGCALRARPFSGALKPQRVLKNILVALATNIEEYVKVLHFLNQAFDPGCSYVVRLRPHPVFPLDEALKICGRIGFKFEVDRGGLEASLSWADALVYVHSSLAIEGLARGIPAVWLRTASAANPDPLFDFMRFKWAVDTPEAMIPVLAQISALSEMEFKARQEEGAGFARKYMCPVTEESMERFLE